MYGARIWWQCARFESVTCKEYRLDNNINTPEENVLIMTARTWTYYVHGDSMHLMRRCIPWRYALWQNIHLVTICTLWEDVFHDSTFFDRIFTWWQYASYEKMQSMTIRSLTEYAPGDSMHLITAYIRERNMHSKTINNKASGSMRQERVCISWQGACTWIYE